MEVESQHEPWATISTNLLLLFPRVNPGQAWCASVLQRSKSDVSEDEERQFCMPHGTEDRGQEQE